MTEADNRVGIWVFASIFVSVCSMYLYGSITNTYLLAVVFGLALVTLLAMFGVWMEKMLAKS